MYSTKYLGNWGQHDIIMVDFSLSHPEYKWIIKFESDIVWDELFLRMFNQTKGGTVDAVTLGHTMGYKAGDSGWAAMYRKPWDEVIDNLIPDDRTLTWFMPVSLWSQRFLHTYNYW